GLWEIGVLLDRRDLAAVGAALRILVRHVAALAGLRLRTAAERQRTVGGGPRAIVAEGPLRIGRLFVGMTDRLIAVQNRQVHRVAGAAQFRAEHVGIGLGVDADRVLHRFFLRLREGSIHLPGWADEKAAGECLGKSAEAGIERLLPFGDAFVLRLVLILGLVR